MTAPQPSRDPAVVAQIISDLRRFPPFDRLDDQALDVLAKVVEVSAAGAGEVLFSEGEQARPDFFVVKNGLVELRRREDGDGADRLIEICDEGDVFGVRALVGTGVYSATARAREASELYRISWVGFTPLMASTPYLAEYFRSGFTAEVPSGRAHLLAETEQTRRAYDVPSQQSLLLADDRAITPVRDVLMCLPSTSVRQAAQSMRDRHVGSTVVVDSERRPLGIVTDADICNRVVAPGLDAQATPVSAVMSTPVQTLAEPQTPAALVEKMMQEDMHHFCFTEDGTAATPVIGLVAERELLSAHGSHPTVLHRRIARSRNVDELRVLRDRADQLVAVYLENDASVRLVSSVVSGLNDALIQSAVEVALEGFVQEGRPRPPERFAWLSFGSEGREEQLLRTDLDNGLVYEDPEPDRREAAAADFLELGQRVVEILVHAGFERCPGNVMASNPDLNRPLSEWKKKFGHLIESPDPKALMWASIFFDVRAVAGSVELGAALWDHIFEVKERSRGFLTFLAKNAESNPAPLSFFRNFVMERSGAHADTFDIKARAMMPLSDAARVFALDLEIRETTRTPDRMLRAMALDDTLGGLPGEAATAYELFLRTRAREGFRTASSGRYVDISRLKKLERQALRNAFQVVDDVLRRLASRYRTEFLR